MDRGMWTSPAIFNNIFDERNFSLVSYLSDNNNSYERINQNVRTKCIIFGEGLKLRG